MTPTILIVDDDPGVLRSSERLLKRDGFVVWSAFSSADALIALQETELPSLIICDGDLGHGHTGREFYDAIQERLDARRRAIPFVAYTGNPELFAGAACPVVEKPDTEGLLAAIRAILERRAA